MAATPSGKDKLMRHARLHIGGYNLSGDARTVGTLENSFGEADMTGWNQEVRNYLADGHRVVGIRGFQALLNDDAGRSFVALKDGGATYPAVLFFGGGGQPAVPDPAYLMPGIVASSTISLDGSVFSIGSDVPFNANALGTGSGNPMGVTLTFGGKTETVTGESHDNGAATAAGWSAILNVTETDGGAWEFKLQHGTDDTNWADLATFTLDGSAIGGEYLSGTGTVNRYVRLLETRTSGSLRSSCAFARN